MRKILMAVGGTGGHLFPAIALADDLETQYGCQVEFGGGKLASNPFIEGREGVFHDISCGKLTKNPLALLKQCYYLLKGVKQGVQLIRKMKPDAIVGFGSYHSLPLLIAGKLTGKKIFLHEGNIIPGKVNRLFAPLASKVWIQFPDAQKHLKVKAELGRLPLRKELKKGVYSPEEARSLFQLSPHLLTILVIGGSQGAKKINSLFSEAVLFHLKDLIPEFQVIHAAGSQQEMELLMGRYVSKSIPAYVRPFIKNMGAAWSAATMSVTRAGCSTISEQMEFEVPGIVIPYPLASEDHQTKNGEFFVKTGLGIKLPENELTPQNMAMKIQEFYIGVQDRQEKYQAFKVTHQIPNLSELIIEAIQ